MKSSHEFVIRHVLVALDGSAHSMAALQVATELAAGARAELAGLFVEDALLLRLAQSPLAREVLYPSARHAPLDMADMEQRLRARAEQTREALSSSARRAQVRWSFRVVRGEVTAEVLAAASQADVLALGKAGWSLSLHWHLGSTALAASVGTPRAVLLVQRAPLKRQVFVIDDGAPGSRQRIVAGAQLAEAYGNKLLVLVSAGSERRFPAAVSEATALLPPAHEHLQVHFRHVSGTDAVSIAHAIGVEGGGILVLHEHMCPPELLQKLLRHLDSPILLLRQTDEAQVHH